MESKDFYINGTLDFGLKFTASEDVEANESGNELYGYSDANWEGDVDTRRSASGYVLKVANCKAKCYESQATQEAIWI